jgi:hypothetical protein
MSIYLVGNPAAAERSRQWCKRTGLKLSKAQLHTVFGVKSLDHLPEGFDHTVVYCIGRRRVILTEPYGPVERLCRELDKFANPWFWKDIEYCVGDKDRSIWNPGDCTPVLIGIGDHGFDLPALLSMLPMTRNAMLKELLPGVEALFGVKYEKYEPPHDEVRNALDSADIKQRMGT